MRLLVFSSTEVDDRLSPEECIEERSAYFGRRRRYIVVNRQKSGCTNFPPSFMVKTMILVVVSSPSGIDIGADDDN